jgi:PAS domain S-box-containing protein
MKNDKEIKKDSADSRQSEESIINSHKLFQRIIDLLPTRIFWKDKDLKYLGCNEIFAKDAGRSRPEELIGKDDFEMAWKEQAGLYRADDQAVMDSGNSKMNFEEPQTTPEGNRIWLKTSKIPLTDLQGNTIGILGSYEDITERKQAEETAQQEQALNNAIIDSIPGAFYVLDANGRYVRWNAYQRDEIIGKSEDMVAGTNAIDTIHPDDRALIQSKIENVFKGSAVETVEGRVLMRGGPEFKWLLMTGRQMVINGSLFLVGIGVDITERKQAEEIIRAKIEEIEKMNKIMIGRELKMVEIKKENEKLKESKA